MKLFLTFILATLFSSPLSIASDLTGPITRSDLEKQNYPWMKEGLAKASTDYAKQSDRLKKLSGEFAKTDIEIYLGTWCGDSHDHVPPFLALLDETKKLTNLEPKSLKLFARAHKSTDGGLINGRKIERLPTFVFLRGGKEIGRIIETPTKSILDDTAAIVRAEKSP